ncbi:Nuclear pore complex protein [Dirofilaria immitis]
MADAFVDIPDFQFRALQRVRIFNKTDVIWSDGICPSWITTSSRYGIIVCASGCDKLISLRSGDIHRLNDSKTDISVEVTNIQMKVTNLQVEKPASLTEISCNCSGRLLSVLMRTASGAFVYLYDMCSFAVDYVEQRGPVYSLRLSAHPNAQPCALKWNPQQDTIFAVATSDGVLSCYSYNIEESSSIVLIGTIKHNDMVTCIGWSPKGKQLIVGDISGYIKQYKPEMILVRVTSPPTDIITLKDENALRCVGIIWLTTTDFLIAYSTKTGRKVNISKLCIKKDAPPQWTHFDDINFCGEKSIFDQRIEFTQLVGWKLVLCSSSRSSEVALLGKIDSEWKVWTLDDNGRIEMPLDAEHCETYPVGVSVDVSSVLPVKIEGNVERPSCPTVLALSSQGILLAFNALSFRVEHQSINIQPEDLPSEIYGTVLTRADIIQSEHSCIDAPDRERQTISAPVNSRGSTDSFKSRSISNQNAIPLQMQAKINISQSVQATTASKLHELLPCHKPQRSTDQQQQLSEHLQHQQLKTNASFSSTHLFTELQENLQKKLVIFDKQFFDFCERNDWLQNLRKSSAKQLEWNSGINLDDEMLELEKVRTVVSSWLDALENQMKDSMCSIEEQLGIANSTDRELFDNRRMLDFNSMHRLDKLVGALTKLEQKVANIEDILLEMPTCDTKNRSNLILNIDQEQQIATTAKNICKRIISRRKILYELQQRITNLSIQLKLLKKDQGADKFFASTKSSLSNSSLAYHTSSEELERTVVVSAQQQRELLKFLTQRGPVKQSEAKIVLLDNHSHEADEEISNSISNSTITDIENRLLEAALMPIKTPAKLVMDIGTQSSDYLFFKEAKSYVDMVISTPIISKSFTSSETDKPLTIRSNHFQKIAESDLNSSAAPSSFMNLSSSTAAIPTTSSLFATNAIVKQSPAEKSSKTVPETVALCQVQPSDITFSFKNLDAPSTARNNISSREKTSTIMQKTASIGSAITSESLTNISAAAVSSSTTTTEIDRTSTQNFGTSKTNKEMAIIDSSPTSTTASKTLSAETNVSFTFKLPAAGNQQTASSQADFVSDAINTMIESQSKDFDVLGDDGMMEAEGTSTVPTTLFSSSLSFGLENAISNPNATQNVFGSGLKFLPSAQSQTASLFGNADAGNKNISAFSAAGPTTSNDGRLFSRMQQSNATSTSFSFSSVANPHSSSCLFGTKSTTSVTTFGSTPSFGSKPVFGSPSPLVSAFSQQRFQHTAPTTTAFSNFAKTSTVGFGSLAASQQQQSSVSVFGGSGFGAVAQQPQKNTIFGGGLNSSLTNSSSFSTWR